MSACNEARAVLEDLCIERRVLDAPQGCNLSYLTRRLAENGQWDPIAESLARESGANDRDVEQANAIARAARVDPWYPLVKVAKDLIACLTPMRRPSEVSATERDRAKRVYISAGKRIPRKWDQEWRLVEAKRVARRRTTSTEAPYLDRLRLRLKASRDRAALELAEEYHRTVRPLYRSAMGYIASGSTGGEDISRDRYAKSWHNKYGPSRFRFAGVTINPQGNAVLHPVTGRPVTLNLRAWMERREIEEV